MAQSTQTVESAQTVEQQNKATIQAGFDRWKNGEGSIYDLLAPDAKWTIVGTSLAAGTYNSRQEFLDTVIKPFNARVSKPLMPAIRGMVAEGDMVVVLWVGVATAKDGKPYRNTYSWFLQVDGKEIVGATAFFDTQVFDDFWTRVSPDQ